MNISSTDARALFTKKLIDLYFERPKVMSFLRSFFVNDESDTKEISIEVERGTELIAADVERGTEGNRNTWNKSTEKIFVPPYYREWFDATDIDLYDRLFGSESISASIFAAFLTKVADRFAKLQDKIERAYEKQCADVLQTGIVQLSQFNIDFKRKAESKVNLNTSGAGYWSVGGHDVYADMEAGGTFIRTKGKSQGGVYNAIMGGRAFNALKNNSVFQTRNNLFNLKLDSIKPVQANSVGGVLHGSMEAGSYTFNVWTYPEYYETKSGDVITSVPYIDQNKVIILPESPRFKLAFAAVPQLFNGSPTPKKGAYLLGERLDEEKVGHIMDIKSAGLAVPVAVDQIYTMEVLAP